MKQKRYRVEFSKVCKDHSVFKKGELLEEFGLRLTDPTL
jgi:hypothetical protein